MLTMLIKMVNKARTLLLAVLAIAVITAGCGGGDEADTSDGGSDSQAVPETVRLGYFPNLTHAPAIIGVEQGLFEDALTGSTLETATFNAGTEAIEALFSGAIDMTFIGPNPAINGYAQSNGEALRIVAGSTSGGAALVVRPGISSADDLRGRTLASPSLGNTQDVALRAWLAEEGLTTDATGAGDVSIVPQSNSDTLTAFQQGQIDGAWVPEPWATRLVLEGGGEILVDERDLWPDGRFVTTHLIVRTDFLEQYPAAVSEVLEGLVEAIEYSNSSPEEAKDVTNDGIERVTSAGLSDETIDMAWSNMEFTWDPIASSLSESAEDAVDVGLLEPVELDGIYALQLLNTVLDGRQLAEVAAA
jgi:NitT/TauT family transport system substrate-binding protein